MEILVIEDDQTIGKALYKGFTEARNRCVWVKDGVQGKEMARSQQFDAIILDLMLPGEPGLKVLENIRGEGVRTPVIILTALGSVDERVTGLKGGADDYVVKPFAFSELMARLEAVCRRSSDRPPPVLKMGPLTLDLPNRRLTCNGTEIVLTPTEFELLEYLMRFVGTVVTRKMLCQHIWESDWEGTTNVIEVHINRLRNKLQQVGLENLIQTVRGRGYVFRSP